MEGVLHYHLLLPFIVQSTYLLLFLQRKLYVYRSSIFYYVLVMSISPSEQSYICSIFSFIGLNVMGSVRPFSMEFSYLNSKKDELCAAFIVGCQKIIHEILTWEAKSEVKTEVLHDLKEIGSALYWMSILDIVLVSMCMSLLVSQIVHFVVWYSDSSAILQTFRYSSKAVESTISFAVHLLRADQKLPFIYCT